MIKQLIELFCTIFFTLSPLYQYRVFGNSMSPTFRAGDSVLVNRLIYFFRFPKKDDIVVLKSPKDGKVLIKRITKVVGRKIFVVGDNKEESTDSRDFGFVSRKDLIGKVIYTNN